MPRSWASIFGADGHHAFVVDASCFDGLRMVLGTRAVARDGSIPNGESEGGCLSVGASHSAAVHRQHDAGEVAPVRAGEEEGSSGNVPRVTLVG